MQRRVRHGPQINSGNGATQLALPSAARETESPASDISGRNGSRGRPLRHHASGKQQNNFKLLKMNNSSRTAATTIMGIEQTGSSSHSNQQH